MHVEEVQGSTNHSFKTIEKIKQEKRPEQTLNCVGCYQKLIHLFKINTMIYCSGHNLESLNEF